MRMLVESDVMVPMRDGVRLASDIYRPDDDDRHAVLVHRTPYSKANAWFVGGLMFGPLDAVQQGYVVIVQDTRGRFGSEGEWEPFVNEAADGFDTVEWAAQQPWSTGSVGIYGSSYMGVTTVQALVAAPPHLKAAVAYMTGSDYHNGWTYSGGAFELGFNAWWTTFLGWDTATRVKASDEDREAMVGGLVAATADPWSVARHLPLAEVPAFQAGVAPYWQTWIAHPAYDDYWARLDAAAAAERVEAPLLQIAAWYDNFQRGQIALHEELQDRPHHRIVIGPWDHEAYLSLHLSSAGVRDFGPAAIGGPTVAAGLAFEWFGHWLRDEPSELVRQPRVRYFHMGEKAWQETESWPPEATPTKYYLRSAGRANTRHGDGTLSLDTPQDEPPDGYRYDPQDPVPSTGGRTLHPPYGPAGIQDQAAVEEREDVLVYSGTPLTSPLQVVGPVSATIYASSDGPDTDFTAKLVDVEPDGFCANIAEGIVRARYRNGATAELLEPGVITEFTIDLWDVAHTFGEGHLVRLELSSSNFPRFSRNLNSADQPELGGADAIRVATNEIHHNAEHASFLTLPVIG